jgi:3-oxoacyl-[acyl-carrier protein] reductase
MKEGGAIVNVSSLSGVRSVEKFPHLVSYATSKAALIGFTEALAAELKPLRIRVNAIAPGSVNTKMLHTAFPDYNSSTEAIQIAYPIIDLLDPIKSAKITGATLEINCNE